MCAKATSWFMQDLLHIELMYALKQTERLTLYGLAFTGTYFLCRNNCVASCCTSSMAGNGEGGEASIIDNGD